MVTAPRLDMISGSRARAFPPAARESSRQPASSPRLSRRFFSTMIKHLLECGSSFIVGRSSLRNPPDGFPPSARDQCLPRRSYSLPSIRFSCRVTILPKSHWSATRSQVTFCFPSGSISSMNFRASPSLIQSPSMATGPRRQAVNTMVPLLSSSPSW